MYTNCLTTYKSVCRRMYTKCIKNRKVHQAKLPESSRITFISILHTHCSSIYLPRDEGGAAHFQQGKFLGSATLFKENLPTAFFVALATSQKVILDFFMVRIS